MKDKVIKLLNLTRSDSDGEALSAIRKANALIDACDSSWIKLLGITPQTILNKNKPYQKTAPPPQETVKKRYEGEEVEWMLEEIPPDTGSTFLKSLVTWYNEKHFLTLKQYNALRDWYEGEHGIN
jgi:hypothetical protein